MQFTTDGEFWRLILGRNPNLYMGLPPWPVHSLVKKLLEACVLLASMLPMQFTTGWKFCRSTLGCKSKLYIGFSAGPVELASARFEIQLIVLQDVTSSPHNVLPWQKHVQEIFFPQINPSPAIRTI